MNRRRVCSSVLHVFFWHPNLSSREIPSQIFTPPSPSIVDNVFHKPQGLRTIDFILWLSLREFCMNVCLVWFSLMTRESEIGMKLSAPGDSRGRRLSLPLYPGYKESSRAPCYLPTRCFSCWLIFAINDGSVKETLILNFLKYNDRMW
jgi:hypothetical protein